MARAFRTYVLILVLGGSIAVGAFAGGLTLLDYAGRLPPPPLSNRISFDEKLRFIRNNGPIAPTVLAVGSSQTVNHFNGAVLRDLYGPEVRPLNGGAWAVGPDKLEFLIDFYLSWYTSVKHIVTIMSLPDFGHCTARDAEFFNTKDAADYAFRGAAAFPFYFQYFDPLGLLRTAFLRQYERVALGDADEFGSLKRLRKQDLDPPAPFSYEIDDRCFAALRKVATNLSARGIAFTVVLVPLKPSYVNEFDPDGAQRERFIRGVEAALKGTEASIFNAQEEMNFKNEDFWDSTHLYWDAASRMSYEMALRVGADGRGSGLAEDEPSDGLSGHLKPRTGGSS